MEMKGDNERIQQIGHYMLEHIEKHQTVPHDLLYSRVKKEFPDLAPREFSTAMDQLKTLDLVDSFDGGRDIIYEITREGVCALASR